MQTLDAIILIAIGLVLAFMGKRFIWLLIGLAGFVLAYRVVSWLIPGMFGKGLEIVLGVIAGVIVGWLATKFTKLLLQIAAFILVGNAAVVVLSWFGIGTDRVLIQLIAFAIGGLIGLGLLRWAFNVAVALITVVAGAVLVAGGLRDLFSIQAGSSWLLILITLVVAVAGFMFQQGMGPFKPQASSAAK